LERIFKTISHLQPPWWIQTNLPISGIQKKEPLSLSIEWSKKLISSLAWSDCPHRVSGFSGGGTLSNPESVEKRRQEDPWLSAQLRTGDPGKIENPVKEEIEQVAQRVG